VNRRGFILVLSGAAALPRVAHDEVAHLVTAFRKGLAEAGYANALGITAPAPMR
jgi:hypothetical protein